MRNSTKGKFEPYGATVFCDDVRYERNSQVSLIGVYNMDIQVPQIPCIIPKFGLSVTLVLPPLKKEDVNIELAVFLPGETDTASIVVPNFIPANNVPPARGSRNDDIPPHAKIAQHVVISPLEIKSAGFIKVRASVNGTIIKAGVIRVNLKTSD